MVDRGADRGTSRVCDKDLREDVRESCRTRQRGGRHARLLAHRDLRSIRARARFDSIVVSDRTGWPGPEEDCDLAGRPWILAPPSDLVSAESVAHESFRREIISGREARERV